MKNVKSKLNSLLLETYLNLRMNDNMESSELTTLYINKGLWRKVLDHCEEHKLSPTVLVEGYLKVMLNPVKPLGKIEPSGVNNIHVDCQRRIEDLEGQLQDAGVEY